MEARWLGAVEKVGENWRNLDARQRRWMGGGGLNAGVDVIEWAGLALLVIVGALFIWAHLTTPPKH